MSKPVLHINTAPQKAVDEKGYARYPEDFPHLKAGEVFKAWRVDDGFEVETTLNGDDLLKCLQYLLAREEAHPA